MITIETTGHKIKNLRESKHWTQQQLASKLGINNSVLSKIETDKRALESELLFKFAEIFDVSTDYLVGREMVRETPAAYTPASQAFEYIPIPVYNSIKAAPDGTASYEDLLGYDMMPKDAVSGGPYFLMIVQGEDMAGEGIHAGSKALICRQGHAAEGKIAAVLGAGPQAMLRRIHYQDEVAILTSASRSAVPIVIPRRELNILGQAVQVTVNL